MFLALKDFYLMYNGCFFMDNNLIILIITTILTCTVLVLLFNVICPYTPVIKCKWERMIFGVSLQASKGSDAEFSNVEDSFIAVCFLLMLGCGLVLMCIWPIIKWFNNFLSMIFIFPVIFVLTISLPLVILYELGWYFSMYLRGSSKTSFLFFELLYDFLFVFIILARIIIQNFRMVIIFLCIIDLEETNDIFYDMELIPFADEMLGYVGNTLVTPRSICWFLCYKLPSEYCKTQLWAYHAGYEIFSAAYAFFFLIFWLFIYMYTTRYTIKFEHFFKMRLKKVFNVSITV